MRYWDSSAIVPLCVDEPHSGLARSWLAEDRTVVTWWATATEIVSALMRRVREHSLTDRQCLVAVQRLTTLRAAWSEVLPGLALRSRAQRLLRVHPLRAADAFQLAAALACTQEPIDGAAFLTFDARLADAARKEGFDSPAVGIP